MSKKEKIIFLFLYTYLLMSLNWDLYKKHIFLLLIFTKLLV